MTCWSSRSRAAVAASTLEAVIKPLGNDVGEAATTSPSRARTPQAVRAGVHDPVVRSRCSNNRCRSRIRSARASSRTRAGSACGSTSLGTGKAAISTQSATSRRRCTGITGNGLDRRRGGRCHFDEAATMSAMPGPVIGRATRTPTRICNCIGALRIGVLTLMQANSRLSQTAIRSTTVPGGDHRLISARRTDVRDRRKREHDPTRAARATALIAGGTPSRADHVISATIRTRSLTPATQRVRPRRTT